MARIQLLRLRGGDYTLVFPPSNGDLADGRPTWTERR